jgi:hypothetical protein
VEADSKEVKYWLETMQQNISDPPYGYKILHPKGKQIGLYYSKWDPLPVQMEGENKVSIYPSDKKVFIGPRGDK